MNNLYGRPRVHRFTQQALSLVLLWALLIQPLPLLAAPPARPALEESTFATPTLVGPDDGASTTGLNYPPLGVPSLSWLPVNGAEKYRVEISKSAGFAAADTQTIETYATTYTPEKALADGVYFWRVTAGDSKNWGTASAARSFTKSWNDNGNYVPQLISPAIDAQIFTFTTEHFTWASFPGAARYKFEISADANFSNVVYSAFTLKPRHTPLTRLVTNFYYWRVTPIDNQKNFGQASEARPFYFNWNVAPQLLSPAQQVDLAFLPSFAWTAVEAAAKYELQISTQPEFGSPNIYQTTNTEYTPEKNLSNDQDYYWRVKAIDLQSNSSPWSDVRQFRVRWNFRAPQLVPVNNVIKQSNPFFAWAPIPGAERYQVQVDESNSYEKPLMDETFYNVTTSAIVKIEDARVWIDRDYFWRVRGIDAQGNYTPWSNNNTFRYGYEASPNLVYPLPYFAPDEVNTPVHSDRTIAWPMFIWDNGITFGGPKPAYYELTVAADPSFNDIRFQVETTGLFAAPTQAHPFTNLQDGQLYYWRVRGLFTDELMNRVVQIGVDHVWKTRIDRSVPERPYATTITPIYPRNRAEAVGSAPILGWLPMENADHYRVQVSTDSNFVNIVDEALAQFVNYAPWQGHREPMPFDTYFWRVRAEDSLAQPIGDWSEVRHFHLSQEVVVGNYYDSYPADASNSIFVATTNYYTPSTFVAGSVISPQADYEVGNLHVMLNRVDLRGAQYYPTKSGNLDWIFAFKVSPVISNPIKYLLYVDIDHVQGSGGAIDPLGKPIVTDSYYLPELVFVIDRAVDNSLLPNNVTVYKWNDTLWGPAELLSSKGGDAWFDGNKSVVQILVPVTTISSSEEPNDDFAGSLALAVLSSDADPQTGIIDSTPAQSNSSVTRFALVADMLMPLYPLDTPLSNPMVHYDVPPLRWRLPYGTSNDGYEVQVARDAKFTDIVNIWELSESNTDPFYSFLTTTFQPANAYEDNESYYWRVRVRHERYTNTNSQFDYGTWSPAMRFKLDSRQVGNPQLSTGNLAETTPSFSWDRVEGASGYTIQVDDDANFSSPILINKKLDGTSYTPLTPLPDGLYYWRVAVRRSSTVVGHWTPTMTFTKQSLTPTPLTPINSEIINEQPTFSWTAILTPTQQPRVATALYRLELSADPNFGSPKRYVTESTTFTPYDGESLSDGTWYWRVAVMVDSKTVGTYSPTQQFYKEYLTPTLVKPDQNSVITSTTSFEWAPIPGAARYEILIDDEPLFNNPVKVTATTDSNKYTPTKALANAQYYWRVRMIDEDGKAGPFANGLVKVLDVAYSIGNAVWIDANNNGFYDNGEKPVPDGVVLELLDGTGVSLNTTTQSSKGYYLFPNLSIGDYRVRLAASNFATGGLLQNYRHSTGINQEADPNANGDQNDNGLDTSQPATEGITSGLISLSTDEPTGETPTASRTPGDDGRGTLDANSNLTVDFALLGPPPTANPSYFLYLPVITRQ